MTFFPDPVPEQNGPGCMEISPIGRYQCRPERACITVIPALIHPFKRLGKRLDCLILRGCNLSQKSPLITLVKSCQVIHLQGKRFFMLKI
ncbi:MAG: hypothetical protein M0Q91_11400 [Methanoregula sp.]|nr:hypothetical protein [Methanoregula sp.]